MTCVLYVSMQSHLNICLVKNSHLENWIIYGTRLVAAEREHWLRMYFAGISVKWNNAILAKLTSQGASGPIVCCFSQYPIRLPAFPLTHPVLSQSGPIATSPNTTSLCFHWHWPHSSSGLSSALICNTRPFC